MTTRRRTGIIFFPAFDWSISATHPEREERLLYTQDQVFEEGLFDFDNIIEYNPGIASLSDINRVHFCVPDCDSIMTESHRISAGGAITAAEKVMDGSVDNAFALVRPPGHHAMRFVYGTRGFCTVNVEAVMVEHIRRRYGHRRVAIVDTDCHHGDGTQDIYWHDPDTLYISLHQDGRTLYPGTGFIGEFGGPNALGTTINIPLPPHTSDEGFLYVCDNLILPVIDEFQPDLIVNSAGQDNHFTDPLTSMNFSAQGYAALTSRLSPHIAVLEGGYSIESALPYVNLGIILALAGLDYSNVTEPAFDPREIRQSDNVTERIKRDVATVYHLWKTRHQQRDEFIENTPTVTRRKNIFYDTDHITEKQVETVFLCDECGGLVTVSSATSHHPPVFAVIIPGRSCPSCRRRGEEIFHQTTTDDFHAVYIQDREHDVFCVKEK